MSGDSAQVRFLIRVKIEGRGDPEGSVPCLHSQVEASRVGRLASTGKWQGVGAGRTTGKTVIPARVKRKSDGGVLRLRHGFVHPALAGRMYKPHAFAQYERGKRRVMEGVHGNEELCKGRE